MTLGTRLQAARKIKGYGLRDVESVTGIPFSNISRVERDLNDIGIQSLCKLARCYGVLVIDLIAPDEEMPEMTDSERDAFLVAHGYNLEQLDREIHELIDKLKAEASVIVARKGNENA